MSGRHNYSEWTWNGIECCMMAGSAKLLCLDGNCLSAGDTDLSSHLTESLLPC